jgi:hypothetical protein
VTVRTAIVRRVTGRGRSAIVRTTTVAAATMRPDRTGTVPRATGRKAIALLAIVRRVRVPSGRVAASAAAAAVVAAAPPS